MSRDGMKPFRAKKGDLFVKLQFEDGASITLLVAKDKINSCHRQAMKRLADVVTKEMFGADKP